jgi:hypothetical protein
VASRPACESRPTPRICTGGIIALAPRSAWLAAGVRHAHHHAKSYRIGGPASEWKTDLPASHDPQSTDHRLAQSRRKASIASTDQMQPPRVPLPTASDSRPHSAGASHSGETAAAPHKIRIANHSPSAADSRDTPGVAPLPVTPPSLADRPGGRTRALAFR